MANKTAKEVEKYLKEKELDGIVEIYDYPAGFITIHINGDWKHSHGYCDYLMTELGFTLVRELEIKDDDDDVIDDWYEAERTYKQN